MKRFVYVVTEKPRDRNGNPRSTINVYAWNQKEKRHTHIHNANPQVIGYRDADQAAIEIVIEAGLMPSKALGGKPGHAMGGTTPKGKQVYINNSLWQLKEQGILSIERLY